MSEHLECPGPSILRFKTQFTAGRAVHVGLLDSAVLTGLRCVGWDGLCGLAAAELVARPGSALGSCSPGAAGACYGLNRGFGDVDLEIGSD